jgi:hypothetical protein
MVLKLLSVPVDFFIVFFNGPLEGVSILKVELWLDTVDEAG